MNPVQIPSTSSIVEAVRTSVDKNRNKLRAAKISKESYLTEAHNQSQPASKNSRSKIVKKEGKSNFTQNRAFIDWYLDQYCDDSGLLKLRPSHKNLYPRKGTAKVVPKKFHTTLFQFYYMWMKNQKIGFQKY